MQFSRVDDMLLFVEVVDHKSFTKAAQSLGISKSIVSKRITRLEQELQTQLLNRSTRKLSLTEVGEQFYQFCARIRSDVRDAELAVSYSHAQPQGILKIHAPSSFGHVHMSTAISEFIGLYPEVEVEMVLGGETIDLVESGFDVGIRIGVLPDSSLIARKLATRPMRVCGAPSYFEKHGVPNSPNDLLEHNCLIHKQSVTGAEWHFLHKNKTQSVKVKGAMQSNSAVALLEAAKAGLGLVMLPGYLATSYIKQGSLRSILAEYCPKDIGIYAVYPHNRYLTPKVKQFLDFLTQRYSNENYWNAIA